jgi:RNA polymerase primary sigma factor
VHSSQEIDDLLSILERQGIEIYEDLTTANAARAAANVGEAPEADSKEELAAEASLDLSVGVDTKSQDPVRIYLREMGSVPLLTREGEVLIAKRIERGLVVVMKAITRSPIVIKELIAVGDDLRKGARSIKEVVQFDDEELTEAKIANKTKQTLKHIDRIADLYETAQKQA